jgi:hypothetical protein
VGTAIPELVQLFLAGVPSDETKRAKRPDLIDLCDLSSQ